VTQWNARQRNERRREGEVFIESENFFIVNLISSWHWNHSGTRSHRLYMLQDRNNSIKYKSESDAGERYTQTITTRRPRAGWDTATVPVRVPTGGRPSRSGKIRETHWYIATPPPRRSVDLWNVSDVFSPSPTNPGDRLVAPCYCHKFDNKWRRGRIPARNPEGPRNLWWRHRDRKEGLICYSFSTVFWRDLWPNTILWAHGPSVHWLFQN